MYAFVYVCVSLFLCAAVKFHLGSKLFKTAYIFTEEKSSEQQSHTFFYFISKIMNTCSKIVTLICLLWSKPKVCVLCVHIIIGRYICYMHTYGAVELKFSSSGTKFFFKDIRIFSNKTNVLYICFVLFTAY